MTQQHEPGSEQAGTGWHEACRVDEIAEGGCRVVLTTDCPARALFKVDGELYAIDDMCSHGRSSLSEGFVEGTAVECVLHGALFDLRSGEPLTPPATIPMRTYPVRVDDGAVFVRDAPH